MSTASKSHRTTHTPGPWEVHVAGREVSVQDSRGLCICLVTGGLDPFCTAADSGPATHANAEFIVRACNAHDDLLAALRGIVEVGKRDLTNPKYDGYFDAARAAIAEAEGRNHVA